MLHLPLREATQKQQQQQQLKNQDTAPNLPLPPSTNDDNVHVPENLRPFGAFQRVPVASTTTIMSVCVMYRVSEQEVRRFNPKLMKNIDYCTFVDHLWIPLSLDNHTIAPPDDDNHSKESIDAKRKRLCRCFVQQTSLEPEAAAFYLDDAEWDYAAAVQQYQEDNEWEQGLAIKANQPVPPPSAPPAPTPSCEPSAPFLYEEGTAIELTQQ